MQSIYYFGKTRVDGRATQKNLLGGKGANLAEMAFLGIPVPPGFTISTEVCHTYQKEGKLSDQLIQDIEAALADLENETEKKFGSKDNPLLISVRSGAPVSMPGMMDTILNLGLNDEILSSFVQNEERKRFALDSYRRLIQMFGEVVLEIPAEKFEDQLTAEKKRQSVTYDYELSPENLTHLIEIYKKIVRDEKGRDFPQDPKEQLLLAVEAVFRSWSNPRAKMYRRLNHISETLGTAVNVQSMVFGNSGNSSGTGVLFSRHPSTGEKLLFGEYLENAQGEDVVAGIRTPHPIADLKGTFPEIYDEIIETTDKLEKHFHDMQDIEFTIENEKLFILQTRSGKRTALASLHIALDLYREGLINRETAILRIDPESVSALLANVFQEKSLSTARSEGRFLAHGLPAGPGAAHGRIALTAEEAIDFARKGEQAILMRIETSPEDIAGMDAASAIVTARGGMTSHAAVVARGMNKTCVVGAGDVHIDMKSGEISFEKDGELKSFHRGDFLSIDGYNGDIYEGIIETSPSEIQQVFIDESLSLANSEAAQKYKQLTDWISEISAISVRANAETPQDAKHARKFGALGIGLARTEHMFFSAERILQIRRLILSSEEKERESALEYLLGFQKKDFIELFREMDGHPVTIRLLDPPLHEFLPGEEEQLSQLAKDLGEDVEKIRRAAKQLHEVNPMLGHRGCRLGITFPEITRIQGRAIFLAAAEVIAEGKKVFPEIMVPLVGSAKELELQKKVIDEAYAEVLQQTKLEIPYKTGSMIEVPRAALTADELAQTAEFFSFGTNDLTQMTLGFSRDDIGKFLPDYLEAGIYERDPFLSLDQKGVGELMRTAITKGRSVSQKLSFGICGEHGGDPASIRFGMEIGINYVSVSPYRVPVARLAAAQATIEHSRQKHSH